eukprot:Hpha_TRINITY_DN15175_c0_g1::TRINITY_DN15175_c0_g1_i3::g.127598::m.127598
MSDSESSSCEFQQIPAGSALLGPNRSRKPKQGVRWDAGTKETPGHGPQRSHAMSFATTNESLAFEECSSTLADTAASLPAGGDGRSAVSGSATQASLQFVSCGTLGDGLRSAATVGGGRRGGGDDDADDFDDMPHAYRSARARAVEEDDSSDEGLEEALRESLAFKTFATDQESLAFKTHVTQASLMFRSCPGSVAPGSAAPGSGSSAPPSEAESSVVAPVAPPEVGGDEQEEVTADVSTPNRVEQPKAGTQPPPPAADSVSPVVDESLMPVQQKDGKGLVRFLAVGESGKQQVVFIPDGTQVRVLCQQYNWAQVEYHGLVGVVKRKDLGLVPSRPSSGPSGSPTSQTSGQPVSARGKGSPLGKKKTSGKIGWSPPGRSTATVQEEVLPRPSARSTHTDPSAPRKPPVEKRGFFQPREIDRKRASIREEEQKLRKSGSRKGPWVPVGGDPL